MNTTRIGRAGEEWIAEWFVWQGYQVQGRNILTPYGEIDLWVSYGRRHYGVEVKTRKYFETDLHVMGLTPQKYKRLKILHAFFQNDLASSRKVQCFCSFIILVPRKIYWLPNIFDPNMSFVTCSYVSSFTKPSSLA